MNRETFYKQVRAQLFSGRLAQGQVDGMEAILNEWETRDLKDSRYLAYMLATAFHETAFTMQPIEEYGKGRKYSYGLPDKVTGKTYFGRGFVQLTWKRNYESMGDILNVDLVNNPEQALDLKTATQVLFEGMLRGTFTPPKYYKLADFFTEHSDWYNARKIINGLDRAEQIAGYGRRFYFALLESVGEIQKVQDVSKDLTTTTATMENNLVEVKELAREFAPSTNTANTGAQMMQSTAPNACLLIGIADYFYIRPLPTTVIADVDALHALIATQQLGFYAPEYNVRLTNAAASKTAIQTALAQLAQWASPESTVLIYISSHGQNISSGAAAGSYLLPIETQVDSDGLIVPETAISHAEFSQGLRQIKAKRLVVMLDLCHAGGIGEAKALQPDQVKSGFADRHLNLLAGGSGRVIMAASRANEQSWILNKDRNSLFTKYLLAGLQGQALSVGGVIRVFDLFHYVQPRVTAEKADQHPIFKAELEENFPIALAPAANLMQSDAALNQQAKAETGWAYDVFVSYCKQIDEDAEWVHNQLIPTLKQAGVKVCADTELGCFRLGRPVVTEMQRAVEHSRFTLAVFSPDYLDSGFSELENTMAQFLGAETQDVRFMGLIWRDCKPDLRFRSRLLLNMQASQEFQANIQRIVYECLH